MKTRILIWILSVFAMALVLYGIESILLQKSLAEKTVRLHVVANSDSEEDQAHKIEVRDAVLRQVCALTANCKNAKEARTVIHNNLTAIQEAAERVSEYNISVSLQTEAFDTRPYDTFTLPAGDYPALRVNIGQAQGENWWCVVFPAMCVSATSDEAGTAAMVGGFTQEEAELVTGGEKTYCLRFKTLEWLKKIRELFS